MKHDIVLRHVLGVSANCFGLFWVGPLEENNKEDSAYLFFNLITT